MGLAEDLRSNGVIRNIHSILKDTRHTDLQPHMPLLLERRNTFLRRNMMQQIFEECTKSGAEVIVPVTSLVYMFTQDDFSFRLPTVVPINLHGDQRNTEPTINYPPAKELVKRAGQIALFSDVVQTGEASLAMARLLRANNQNAQLDLIAFVQQGQVDPAMQEVFATQTYLIPPLMTWPEEDCIVCPLK